jgi:hypothetical protein
MSDQSSLSRALMLPAPNREPARAEHPRSTGEAIQRPAGPSTRATQEPAELRHQQELYDLLIQRTTRTLDAQSRNSSATSSRRSPPRARPRQPLRRVRREGSAGSNSRSPSASRKKQDAAYAAQVRRQVDAQLDGLQLDRTTGLVLAYAINALPATDAGPADIEQAHQVFVDVRPRQREWAAPKRAPHIALTGRPPPRSRTSTTARSACDWMVRRAGEQ